MRLDFANNTLLIPNRTDIERDAVASAWSEAGGDVLRLDRFWEPPDIDVAKIKVYVYSIMDSAMIFWMILCKRVQ